MDALVEELLGRAFTTRPAEEANAAIALVRQERGGPLGDALSYEGVLPAGREREHLCDVLLPRLVYFLDCRGARPPSAPGVFVSLFHERTLYFLAPEVVFDVLGRATGLSVDEMVERFGAAASDSR